MTCTPKDTGHLKRVPAQAYPIWPLKAKSSIQVSQPVKIKRKAVVCHQTDLHVLPVIACVMFAPLVIKLEELAHAVFVVPRKRDILGVDVVRTDTTWPRVPIVAVGGFYEPVVSIGISAIHLGTKQQTNKQARQNKKVPLVPVKRK